MDGRCTIIHKQEKNKIEISKDVKVFNYGLALLKSLLAFSVVISHNYRTNPTKNKIIFFITSIRVRHVPAFFIMSFYFMCNNIISLKKEIFVRRLIRLLIPYFIWPIIIWYINHFLNFKYNKRFPDSFQSLKSQILWGSTIVPQFWFQWNLIVITLIFYTIKFIFRNNFLTVLYSLLILSYALQYSNYCYNNYYLKLPNYKKYTISRLFGMLPLSITGFICGLYKVINLLHKHKIKTLFFSTLIYTILSNYNIFINLKEILYYGINLNLQALCMIFIFSIFPSYKIKNIFIKKTLIYITNYSAGVFYLHLSIKNYFQFFLKDIQKGTFLGIIINYIICYFICFFGMLIFGKTSFKYLFS